MWDTILEIAEKRKSVMLSAPESLLSRTPHRPPRLHERLLSLSPRYYDYIHRYNGMGEIDVDCNLIRKTCALDEKIVQTFRIFHYLEHKIDD